MLDVGQQAAAALCRQSTPGFKASMQYKDLNIVMDMARAYGVPLPSAAVATQLFNAMVADGWGDL